MVMHEEFLTHSKAHWNLHMNAVLRDSPQLEEEIKAFTDIGEYPNVKHPAYVHDWFENPGRRAELEAYDG